MTTFGPIVWTRGELDLVYLVETRHRTDIGATEVLRWCGPRSRSHSGVRIGTSANSGPQAWEGRLSACTIDEVLGSPMQSVQALSDIDLRVSCTPSEPVFASARSGYWRGGQIRVWLWERNSDTVQIVADGRVDREPSSVTADGFSLRATVGPISLADQWPTTRMPDSTADAYTYVWTHRDTATATTDHFLHPGTAVPIGPSFLGVAVPEWAQGARVGTVYGEDVYREVVYYGLQATVGSTDSASLFFHVSPQFGCDVEEVYFEDATGTLRSVTPASGPHYLATFNNYDPACGPVGTNCVIVGIDKSYWLETTVYDAIFAVTPWVRCFARINGPLAPPAASGYSLLSTPTPWHDGNRQRVTAPGGTLHLDNDVLRHLWEVQLGYSSPWVGAAPLNLALGPSGPTSGAGWRGQRAAVPKRVETEAPSLREPIADLLLGVQADLCQRYDAAANSLGLWVARRRPWSSAMAAAQTDHVITRADFVRGHPGAVVDWRLTDDPGGIYATRVAIDGPDEMVEPVEDATGIRTDEFVRGTYQHRDLSRESLGDVQIERERSRTYWRQSSNTGRDDAMELLGGLATQRQDVTDAVLGARRFGVQLTDTVRFHGIDGMPETVGQVRRRTLDLDRQTVKIQVWHLEFCAWGHPPSKGVSI